MLTEKTEEPNVIKETLLPPHPPPLSPLIKGGVGGGEPNYAVSTYLLSVMSQIVNIAYKCFIKQQNENKWNKIIYVLDFIEFRDIEHFQCDFD